MDLWVVGAAAAAGYIARYWQKFSRDRDGPSELSSQMSKHEKHENLSWCPLNRLTHRRAHVESNSNSLDNSLDGRSSAAYQLDIASEAEGVSTSGSDKEIGNLDSVGELNVLSLSSSLMRVPADKQYREHGGGSGPVDDSEYVSRNHSLREMDSFHGSARNRISLRAKCSYGQFIRPLTSQESCLMAQLFNEHAKMEEYVLSTCSSSYATMRPLLVVDGSQIISRANMSPPHSEIGNASQMLHRKENAYGLPSLQKVQNLELPKKICKTGKKKKDRLTNSCRLGWGKEFLPKHGSHDGMILFCLGTFIGLLSSLNAHRKELDKLKGLLKQSENLVQDLQEELVMNDSLTVKELMNGNHESQGSFRTSFDHLVPHLLFPTEDMGISSSNDGKESLLEKAEGSKSMSNIEAELEAELERLGLNVSTSHAERKSSNFIEVDSDYEADFAQGELKADMVAAETFAESESNHETNDSPTAHSCNYAVSPRELSLRLYEVIKLRLENRVRELEVALQSSQTKMQRTRSEQVFQQKWSANELRYLTVEEVPAFDRESTANSQPMVMSLSGEALAAYHEACEELTKFNDSEEDNSSCGVSKFSRQTSLYSLDRRMPWDVNSEGNGSVPHFLQSDEKLSNKINSSQLYISPEHTPRIHDILCGDVCENQTSERESDNEMEKHLIMQIVEKTKKGSPAVLNAQRLLFSVDDE